MGTEKERKFLLKSDEWNKFVHLERFVEQGYINTNPACSVRVRVVRKNLALVCSEAFITIKGLRRYDTRTEFEYEIPELDARDLFKMCSGSIIKKTRFILDIGEDGDGQEMSVDVFEGDNKGLVLLEIESKGRADIFIPDFAGDDVTDDDRYYNLSLSQYSYNRW